MSTDRDVTHIVRSWLDVGSTALPDRVLDAVLDQLSATPQRRAWWPAWRFPYMDAKIKLAIAATALVVVALVGINLLPSSGGVGGPSPTPVLSAAPSPSLTPNPDPSAFPASGRLAPGTYLIDDPFPLRVSIAVGDRWDVWSGVTPEAAAIYKDSPDPPNGKGVIVSIVKNVYANACDVADGLVDPGPTVDDLATVLASQPRTEASPITDVSLAGYAGKYLEYSMTGPQEPGCAAGTLNRWPTVNGPRQALLNEHDKVWILDIDGVRLVIDVFSFPGASAADHAEVQAIVDSIQIEP